jgi:hypothetical protein
MSVLPNVAGHCSSGQGAGNAGPPVASDLARYCCTASQTDVFAELFENPTLVGLPTHGHHVLFGSTDGGAHFSERHVVRQITAPCFFVDPGFGRCVIRRVRQLSPPSGDTESSSGAGTLPPSPGCLPLLRNCTEHRYTRPK